MRKRIITGALMMFTAIAVQAQSADAIQKALNAQAKQIAVWTDDKVLTDAVRAQNAKKIPLKEIQRRDEAWIAGKSEANVEQILTGPCADRLRALMAKTNVYGEAFVMDDQGALVCAAARTSDYWQGDEAKWIRSFAEGRGEVFVDRPRYDESAKMNLADVSVPIMEGHRAIGVIMAGVKVDAIKK